MALFTAAATLDRCAGRLLTVVAGKHTFRRREKGAPRRDRRTDRGDVEHSGISSCRAYSIFQSLYQPVRNSRWPYNERANRRRPTASPSWRPALDARRRPRMINVYCNRLNSRYRKRVFSIEIARVRFELSETGGIGIPGVYWRSSTVLGRSLSCRE
jgi:hypothetical protein